MRHFDLVSYGNLFWVDRPARVGFSGISRGDYPHFRTLNLIAILVEKFHRKRLPSNACRTWSGFRKRFTALLRLDRRSLCRRWLRDLRLVRFGTDTRPDVIGKGLARFVISPRGPPPSALPCCPLLGEATRPVVSVRFVSCPGLE